MSTDSKSIEELYDLAIAEHYDRDRFKLLHDSYQIVLRQIDNACEPEKIESILDLALGTGAILKELHQVFPHAKLSGIDVSAKMIAIAREKLELETFHDNAKNVARYINPDSTDLVLIHFLLAYISPEIIITEAAKLLRPGGFCSIATSTYQSFAKLQMLAGRVLTPQELKLAQVPQTPDALIKLLNRCGLSILEQNLLKKQVKFNSFDEAYNWGLNSGWFTQYLNSISKDKISIVSAMTDVFPLEDEFQATIILAQKR